MRSEEKFNLNEVMPKEEKSTVLPPKRDCKHVYSRQKSDEPRTCVECGAIENVKDQGVE